MMVQLCQMVVRWCMMVYGGYTGKGGQMVKMVQMVYDGRSVSDGCQIVVRWCMMVEGCHSFMSVIQSI